MDSRRPRRDVPLHLPEYRTKFLEEVDRLLPLGLCAKVGQSDTDPACRRR